MILPLCTNFPVENDEVTVTKSNGDMDGSVATFRCDNGFVLGGSGSIQCSAESVDTSWPAPSEDPTCNGLY